MTGRAGGSFRSPQDGIFFLGPAVNAGEDAPLLGGEFLPHVTDNLSQPPGA